MDLTLGEHLEIVGKIRGGMYISVLEPLGSSDHNILIFKVNAPTNFIDSDESELYYDFAAADYSAINRYLNSFNWSEIFSRSFTVEDYWQVFTGKWNFRYKTNDIPETKQSRAEDTTECL